MPIYIHVRTGRQAARDGKTFPGFLAGGDPARGSVGGVLPEFLQHAQPACLYGRAPLGIHLVIRLEITRFLRYLKP